MTRNSKLKIASALIATTLIAAPITSAFASGGERQPWHMNDDGRGHDGNKKGMHGDFGKHGKHGKHDMRRTVPLTTDEAKILIDAMLLHRGATDLKTGDVTSVDEGKEIAVTLLNAKGDVVTILELDAMTGRPDRGEFRELRRLMPRPDTDDDERYDRRFTTEQMTLLANAMAIRFGGGELVLGSITETPRGTYVTTMTNKAGDVVREMELSRVTGRPIR